MAAANQGCSQPVAGAVPGRRIGEIVSNALSDSGFPPQRLDLEITESILMQRNAENLKMLHQLKNLRISIVLDDFGTGYSSLSYLRIFPFDSIKIDQSFVKELSTDADCAAIVSAVTGLRHGLHVDTIAEGVKPEDQLTLVRASGCTRAQGFFVQQAVSGIRARIRSLRRT
jgi:EAL domain-containing protein (putative c-di-GMP-specific phosphodiesterase class I)